MRSLTRRDFSRIAIILGTRARNLLGAARLDETLQASVKRRKIPAAVAMAATADKVTYSASFGARDASSGAPVTAESIFRIASMTKPITSVAAMQLVEQGKISLDEPLAAHLPQLEKLEILDGFDETGKPILRPASKPVTLKRLLTHTAGFSYSIWNRNLQKYSELKRPVTPLVFEPGTRWEYGTNVDWAGRLVEAVTGQTLEGYFQRKILEPLQMKDTSFILPAEKLDRLAGSYDRQPDGSLKASPRTMPEPPKSYNGGGGLYSTANDYVRFMQMILRRGRAAGKAQILQPKTVALMASNQIGDLSAGKMKTFMPEISSDVDFHPGFMDKFGFGFLINTTAYEGGRSAGSLAWGGASNTYFWIDPRRSICGVLLMQFRPFADPEALGLLRDFERGVYGGQL